MSTKLHYYTNHVYKVYSIQYDIFPCKEYKKKVVCFDRCDFDFKVIYFTEYILK